jgi:Tol biopolymer transport system component
MSRALVLLAALALFGSGDARNGPLLVSASPGRAYVLSGGELRLAAEALPIARAHIAPGGKLVAYDTGRPLTSLEVVSVDGTGGRASVTGDCLQNYAGCPFDFAWAPDGKRLAVVLVAKDSTRVRIYSSAGQMLADVTPPAARVLTTYNALTWSPDGRWLGFERFLGTEGTSSCCRATYVLMHPDGSGLRTLFTIHDPIHDTPTVSWAPNGAQLAFVSDAHGDPRFAVVDVASGEVHRLKLDSWQSPPAWSPDSSRLAIADWHDGTIQVIKPSGVVLQKLRVHASTGPVWSPDGKTLAFSLGNPDAPRNMSQVLMIPAGGGHARVVATLPRGSQVIQLEWART